MMSLDASLAAFDHQDGLPNGIKRTEDLARYDLIIRHTKPDLLIETGTYLGASALWFADRVPRVWTIDIEERFTSRENIVAFLGDTTELATFQDVVGLGGHRTQGLRTMVVLDSEHSLSHVMAELALWARIVTAGCYLVVEDTICHYVGGWVTERWDPWLAVAAFLDTEQGRRFVPDPIIEKRYPVTMNPGGWLRCAS